MPRRSRYGKRTKTIATQNLCGLSEKSIRNWMSGWSRRKGSKPPDAIFLQDNYPHADKDTQEQAGTGTEPGSVVP
ncbi:hypothetical protein CCR75_000935 [Bremia lactucae]|uniref:Uncharacterized protein n=1 Tax=Bremia lactucae TaxID=4779 RepID=A0A976FKT1_BRELC|nr:hypothetical protein CCR75_000935 [Bremia lactucae]